MDNSEDFNQVRKREDRVGIYTKVSMPRIRFFNQAINDACLKELEIKGNPIIWTNRRIGEHRISSKIDKGFENINSFN